MERPGEKLRQARERLKLTYRDVVDASHKIAQRRNSDEFAVALSRLADIENKGTVPSIYRLYTLCAIYRLDWLQVLRWYGVPLELLAWDAVRTGIDETHVMNLPEAGAITAPEGFDREIDLSKTTFLSHLVRQWGKTAMTFLTAQEFRNLHYGFVGLADWSMHPILRPGSLVLIDQSRRKIAADGWVNEMDRPIYFLEHREGCHVGWCAVVHGRVLLEPHPSSHRPPQLFETSDIDILGQVTGVAMLLESRKRRRART